MKTIWQCVKSTKEGKRFCPDSKGIPEEVIEAAFVESYRMLCADNKDVLEEFIHRIEKTLNENTGKNELKKLQKNEDNIRVKRKKLLDSYLNGVIAQDIYEETDAGFEKKLSDIKERLGLLENQIADDNILQKRISEFKKALSQNEVLEEFDRGIFESIIEKVIVGGYDEDGNKDPYKITFIYKTGFKNDIDKTKTRFGKSKDIGTKAMSVCSDTSDEVRSLYSNSSDDTCGDGRVFAARRCVEILEYEVCH
jgi:hypothetical protein